MSTSRSSSKASSPRSSPRSSMDPLKATRPAPVSVETGSGERAPSTFVRVTHRLTSYQTRNPCRTIGICYSIIVLAIMILGASGFATSAEGNYDWLVNSDEQLINQDIAEGTAKDVDALSSVAARSEASEYA